MSSPLVLHWMEGDWGALAVKLRNQPPVAYDLVILGRYSKSFGTKREGRGLWGHSPRCGRQTRAGREYNLLAAPYARKINTEYDIGKGTGGCK